MFLLCSQTVERVNQLIFDYDEILLSGQESERPSARTAKLPAHGQRHVEIKKLSGL